MKKIIQKIIILLVLVLLALSLPGLVFSNTSDTPGLIQTKYAWLWAYQDIEIPEYLAENFDHIFERLARFFNVNIQNEKILVWIVDFETLQKLYHKNRENPKVVAAFYIANSNRIYFTPRYINERYITHELINYFFDEYRETAVPALAEFLVWQGLIEKSIIEEFIIREEVKR